MLLFPRRPSVFLPILQTGRLIPLEHSPSLKTWLIIGLLALSAPAWAKKREMANIHFGGVVSGQFAVSSTQPGFNGSVPSGLSGGIGGHLSFFQYYPVNARIAYDHYWVRLSDGSGTATANMNLFQLGAGGSWAWAGIRHSLHAGLTLGNASGRLESIPELGSIQSSMVWGGFLEIREIAPLGNHFHFVFGSKAYYLDWTRGGVHEFMLTLFIGLDFLSV